MSALTLDTPRQFALGSQAESELPIKAATKIFDGSCLSDSGGNGVIAPLTATEAFAGFATKTVDNTAGADGALTITARTRGYVVLSVTGVTGNTDLGSTVYASDENTFTLTSTGNTSIGKVDRFISGTQVVVYFEAAAVRSL